MGRGGASAITGDKVYFLDVDNPRPGTAYHGGPRLLQADRERMAVGLLRLTISQHGYLGHPKRLISVFFQDSDRVQASPKATLPDWIADFFKLEVNQQPFPVVHQLPRNLKRLRENLKAEQSSTFSRERAELCHGIDSETRRLLRNQLRPHHIAIAVLILTNSTFRRLVLTTLSAATDNANVPYAIEGRSLYLVGSWHDLHLDELFLHAAHLQSPMQTPPDPARGRTPRKNQRAARTGDGTELDTLPQARPAPEPAETTQTPIARQDPPLSSISRPDLWLVFIHTANRLIAAANYISSTHLLRTVNKMAAVVHVSPSMSVPMLSSANETMQRTSAARVTRPETPAEGTESEETASGGPVRDREYDSDYSGGEPRFVRFDDPRFP